jgi:SAM-dependent methyltransferase
MALVISFVPDPAKAVAEMVRVVRPGGLIAAYMWDQPGGGSPQAPIFTELRAMGLDTALPASGWASSQDRLRGLRDRRRTGEDRSSRHPRAARFRRRRGFLAYQHRNRRAACGAQPDGHFAR